MLSRLRIASRRLARSAPKAARQFHSSRLARAEEVVILAAKRTPIGAFNGAFSSLKATELGTVAVRAALAQSGVDPSKDVNEVILGNVVSANVGQAPARQVSHMSGLPWSTVCTTINKVCSSGLKATTFAAQSIQLGVNNVVVAGGFESMTNIPFYLPKVRQGLVYGHAQVIDGVVRDGLADAYDNQPMGIAAEVCADTYKFSRQEQDAYALESFRRATEATKAGRFKDEIAEVKVTVKGKETIVSEDEGPKKLIASKVPTLKPAFKPNGTVTAANASALNDGAAALVLANGAWARARGLKPLARIVGYGDAEKQPIEFTTAPSLAIPKAIKHAGLTAKQISFYEINEAFSVVNLANTKLLGLDPARQNVNGGAVALGHPIGASGARIIVTLLNVLKQNNAQYGVAGICNGGGGASAMVIERL